MISIRKASSVREWFFAFVLLLSTAFCLYATTFDAEWSHDDFPVIVDNPDILSLAGFVKNSYPGRPLREFTYFIDYKLFGLEPAGYHIQNIFWHGLNAFLLFALALRLGVSRRGAWLAAFFFLVHPLQVEVVANSSHRKDSLALAFCLLALLAWLRGRRDDRFDTRWLILASLLWLPALMAKENVIVLPAVIFGYELLFCNGWNRLWQGSRWLPAALTLASIGGGWFIYERYLGSKNMLGAMRSMLETKTGLREGFSVVAYYATVMKSWLFNWSRLFWPQDLAIEYHLPPAEGFDDPQAIAAMVVTMLLGFCIFYLWRRLPAAAFGFGWFLLFWLPTSNLIPQVYFAADRYMYAPSAGALLAVAVIIDYFLKNFWSYRLAGAILVSVLAVLCWQQNRVWLTVESLWAQAVKVSPNSSFALNNLGSVYLLKGELLRAKELYERSAAANPINPTAFYNLGLIYERIGDVSRALPVYKAFMAIKDPEFSAERRALNERLRLDQGGLSQ